MFYLGKGFVIRQGDVPDVDADSISCLCNFSLASLESATTASVKSLTDDLEDRICNSEELGRVSITLVLLVLGKRTNATTMSPKDMSQSSRVRSVTVCYLQSSGRSRWITIRAVQSRRLQNRTARAEDRTAARTTWRARESGGLLKFGIMPWGGGYAPTVSSGSIMAVLETLTCGDCAPLRADKLTLKSFPRRFLTFG